MENAADKEARRLQRVMEKATSGAYVNRTGGAAVNAMLRKQRQEERPAAPPAQEKPKSAPYQQPESDETRRKIQEEERQRLEERKRLQEIEERQNRERKQWRKKQNIYGSWEDLAEVVDKEGDAAKGQPQSRPGPQGQDSKGKSKANVDDIVDSQWNDVMGSIQNAPAKATSTSSTNNSAASLQQISALNRQSISELDTLLDVVQSQQQQQQTKQSFNDLDTVQSEIASLNDMISDFSIEAENAAQKAEAARREIEDRKRRAREEEEQKKRKEEEDRRRAAAELDKQRRVWNEEQRAIREKERALQEREKAHVSATSSSAPVSKPAKRMLACIEAFDAGRADSAATSDFVASVKEIERALSTNIIPLLDEQRAADARTSLRELIILASELAKLAKERSTQPNERAEVLYDVIREALRTQLVATLKDAHAATVSHGGAPKRNAPVAPSNRSPARPADVSAAPADDENDVMAWVKHGANSGIRAADVFQHSVVDSAELRDVLSEMKRAASHVVRLLSTASPSEFAFDAQDVRRRIQAATDRLGETEGGFMRNTADIPSRMELVSAILEWIRVLSEVH